MTKTTLGGDAALAMTYAEIEALETKFGRQLTAANDEWLRSAGSRDDSERNSRACEEITDRICAAQRALLKRIAAEPAEGAAGITAKVRAARWWYTHFVDDGYGERPPPIVEVLDAAIADLERLAAG